MSTKQLRPKYPSGIDAQELSKFEKGIETDGILNTGLIEHSVGAEMAVPQGDLTDNAFPSSIRYNPSTDEFEGGYGDDSWKILGGGGIRWEKADTSQTVHNTKTSRGYLIDNRLAPTTVVLPIITQIGLSVSIADLFGAFAIYPLTINAKGKRIYGQIDDMTLSTNHVAATFTWTGDELGWIVTNGVGLGQGQVYTRSIYSNVTKQPTVFIDMTHDVEMVDVYVGGARLSEKKYQLLEAGVAFKEEIPANVEIQVIEYKPLQLTISDENSRLEALENTVNDLKNGPLIWWYTATGGETTLNPGTAFTKAKVEINGLGVDIEDFDIVNNRIVLHEPLSVDPVTNKGDRVKVTIGFDNDVGGSSGATNYTIDISSLRIREPQYHGEVVNVISYYSSVVGVGGGEFYYDQYDTTSLDNGGSIIVTATGKRWVRKVEQLLPVHFGALLGNTSDSIEPLRRYVEASKGKAVDFRGSAWTISGTLDLTSVSMIIADNSCVFQVSQTGFSGSWVITIGNPALPYGQGRANRVVILGSLIIDGMNRGPALNGIYLKGQWFNIGHLRANRFNGTGVQQTAVWDSTIDRISVELCGNETVYAYVQNGGGDTHNASHLKSLQVEQSYNKAISMSGIRDVVDNIHCERTYITTLNDGTTNLPSGLTYTTCSFNMGNSIINQGIIDAYPNSTAPDGTACLTSTPSIVVSMDYSTMNNIAAGGAVISCSFGRQAEYNGFTVKDFYVSEPAEKITLRSPRVIGTLFLGSEIIIENGVINKFTPRNNAYNITITGGAITTIEYTQNIRGLITLNNVTITGDILDLKAPTGSGSGSSVGALYSPTTFNNCRLTNVIGYFNSRAIFNGGFINTVALGSQCAFEFYNTKIGTFGFTGNRAFITRGVQADVVNSWSQPAHYIWPAGTITERVGTAVAGNGVIFSSQDSSTINWKAIVSI